MADNILKGIIQIEATGVGSSLNQVNTAIVKTESGFKKLAPASDKATLALSNLGRVAQDAPYGFIGIANNLNPLLESFQRLKAESGTTGGALKALGSSLAGPGGIGIALSVASSLLVVFGDSLFGASKAAKAAKTSADELKDAISNSFKQAGQEAAEVNGLIAILKSETETRERKLSAIKELQRIQPDIFNNIKLEGNLVTGLDTAYRSYIANLRSVIQADILRAKLSQLITRQLELEGATATGKSKDLFDANQRLIDQAKSGKLGNNALSEVLKITSDKKDAAAQQLAKDIQDVFAQLQQVSDGIKVSELRVRPEKITVAKPRSADFDFTTLDLFGLKKGNLDLGNILSPKARKPETKYASKTEEERAALKKLQDDLLTTQQIGLYLSDTLSNAFAGLVDAIAAGKNVLQSFGNVVKQVITDLIKALVQAAIFSFLTKAFGVVIPTGGGGNPFSGLFGGRRAVGGNVGAGKAYLVGENGPELFAPSMGGNIIPNGRLGSYGGGSLGGQVQFVISGNNLIGVLSAAGRNQRRLV